jgi:protease-4
MASRRPWLRRLGLGFVGVLALVGAGTIAKRLAGAAALSPHVAVVPIEGVISESQPLCDALTTLAKDDHAVAVVLRVDSPGGSVAPSQEIYDEVAKLRDAKPVVASLGNVAASGGYYVASAANVIVADPGTLTGSIGVIMEFPQLGPLAEKIGVGQTVVKSGPYKDIGHPLRPLSDKERVLLQGMVDDVYGQFVDAVARGRGMEQARVRQLADGRVYSGAQAKVLGLVDDLGGLNDAVRLAWTRAARTGEPAVVHVEVSGKPWWRNLLGSMTDAGASLGVGLRFLYGGPTPR